MNEETELYRRENSIAFEVPRTLKEKSGKYFSRAPLNKWRSIKGAPESPALVQTSEVGTNHSPKIHLSTPLVSCGMFMTPGDIKV